MESAYTRREEQSYSKFTEQIPLSPRGEEHAREIAEYFAKEHRIHTIITSGFVRALQTAEIISSHTKAQVVVDDRLRERVLCTDELGIETIQNYNQRSLVDWEWKAPGGESMNEVADRFKGVIDEVLIHTSDVVIVSHSRTIQAYMGKYTKDTTFEYLSKVPEMLITYGTILEIPIDTELLKK